MYRFLFVLGLLLGPTQASAWNAAGHRLVATIAWQQLSPASRDFISGALARHPDYPRWIDKARSALPAAIFAEAATWPDDIRSDPRFYDAGSEPATPALPGLPDNARHKDWHYVDFDPNGKSPNGEIDRQIVRLSALLRSSAAKEQVTYALPWLAHLVADIHQPLHVGQHGDEGGNSVEIENPFNKRLPFSSLHLYWDDLPGPPWLRGKQQDTAVARLIADFPPPEQGDVALWREESHRLLDRVYPQTVGSLLPTISETFHREARALANRRIVEAGYRLGRLLEALISRRNSHETP